MTKSYHCSTALPLLTFAHIKEAKPFIHQKNKTPLPFHTTSSAERGPLSSGMGSIQNIALFRERDYWVLITGIGKMATLIALTHVLTRWGESITEVINIGYGGALTAKLGASIKSGASTQSSSYYRPSIPLKLGTVLAIGAFCGIETIRSVASSKQSSVTLYKKTFTSSDPTAHSTLLTSPRPIGITELADSAGLLTEGAEQNSERSSDRSSERDSERTCEQTFKRDSEQSIAKEVIKRHVPVADVIDMEGYWNAALASQFGKPCSALKIISDEHDETLTLREFTKRLPSLSQTLYAHTLTYLSESGYSTRHNHPIPREDFHPSQQSHKLPKSMPLSTPEEDQAHWKTLITEYLANLQTRFHFTQNEQQQLRAQLEHLATQLLNEPPKTLAEHLSPQLSSQFPPSVVPLQVSPHKNYSHTPIHALWENILAKLETNALTEQTTPLQKKRYLRALAALQTRHWDKVLTELKIITQAAQTYGVTMRYSPALEHITLDIKVRTRDDWKRAETFIHSTPFQRVFAILAGDLDEWYKDAPAKNLVS